MEVAFEAEAEAEAGSQASGVGLLQTAFYLWGFSLLVQRFVYRYLLFTPPLHPRGKVDARRGGSNICLDIPGLGGFFSVFIELGIYLVV
jgi:hypothetical protein